MDCGKWVQEGKFYSPWIPIGFKSGIGIWIHPWNWHTSHQHHLSPNPAGPRRPETTSAALLCTETRGLFHTKTVTQWDHVPTLAYCVAILDTTSTLTHPE